MPYLPITPEGEDFITKPLLHCAESSVWMAGPKTGKTALVLNHPKILLVGFDKNSFKSSVNNYVDGRSYKEIPLKGLMNLKPVWISEDPKGPTAEVKGYNIPPSLFDLWIELKPEMTLLRTLKIKLKQAEFKKDQKEYDDLLEETRGFIKSMKYPIIVFDNLSSLEEEVYECAVRNWDRTYPGSAGSKHFASDLDQYNGVRFKRASWDSFHKFCSERMAPIVVYIGHTAPVKATLKKTSEDITATDLDMEGWTGSIFTKQVEALGVINRESDGIYISYEKRGVDTVSVGSRDWRVNDTSIKLAELAEPGQDPTTVTRYLHTIFPDIFDAPKKDGK